MPFRNLLEIPRLTEEGKKQIMGQAAVGAFTKERVKREVEAKGHPLFWAEWKPVNLFSTLFRDFGDYSCRGYDAWFRSSVHRRAVQ